MRDAEEAILRVWHDSAAPWSRAVREGRIASRRRVTDAAVLAAIHARAPRSVIDLGCGEGWLSRALAGQGIAEGLPQFCDPEGLAQHQANQGDGIRLHQAVGDGHREVDHRRP